MTLKRVLVLAIVAQIIYGSFQFILPLLTEHLIESPRFDLNDVKLESVPKAIIPVTDDDLKMMSEQLLLKDRNNLKKYVSVEIQNIIPKNTDKDMAPLLLFTVDSNVWKLPTFSAIKALYDNYEMDTSFAEDRTSTERAEEDIFVDAIMSTNVMIHLMEFLKNKGIVPTNKEAQKNFIKELWFNLYPRKKGGIESSSSFEHIFLSEIRNNKVLGLHSWIYFHLMEASKKVDYLGYIRNLQLGNDLSVLKFRSRFGTNDKPITSMFIGSSPEFDIAIYTLCLLTRGNKSCRFNFGGEKVFVRVYTQDYLGKKYFGSAYPEI